MYHAPRRAQFWYHSRWLGRLRAPAFRYPHGYAYRRWYAGQSLPLLFLATPYFFNDYMALGIEAPPPGYVWVRYGPDLLLVDRDTGEIDQVLYGVYY
ncbi:MAG TPA: RcnB family protein [Rhizomicrobium sp.]